MANITYTVDADTAKAVDGFLKIVDAQKKTERQFKKTTTSAKQQNKTFLDIHKSILKIAAAAGGIYAIQRALVATVKTGFKFNQLLESSALGIASIVSASYDMVDADGKQLEGLEKINAARVTAKDLQEDLRIAGLKTTATYEQLVIAFQTGLAPGSAAHLGLKEIQKLTVQITQAAGAIGLPMNQLAEEIRSIFQGTITARNTRIATALGITNEDIRRWKEAGTLFDELTAKFGVFSDAGVLAEQTWAGLSSNLIDALQQVLGKGFEPLFEFSKQEARKMMDWLVNIREDGVIELNQELVALGEKGSEALKDIYLIGKDVAWVFGQIAAGVNLTYQTLGTWGRYKGNVEELMRALGNLGDVATGKRDWHTGGKTPSHIVRGKIMPRPSLVATPTTPTTAGQSGIDRAANIRSTEQYGMGHQRDAGVYPITAEEYDEQFGGEAARSFAEKMQETMKRFAPTPETIEAQYAKTRDAINEQYDLLLTEAQTLSDSKAEIDQIDHDRAIALRTAGAEAKQQILAREVENEKAASAQRRQIRQLEMGYMSSFAGDASAIFGEMYARSGEQLKGFFLAQKGMAIAQTVISTLTASMMALGPPLGPVAGMPYSKMIMALGAAKVALIVGSAIQGMRTEKPAGYAMGGIASGPESGYETTLHGTEAIVPLKDGRSIPVQMQGGGASNNTTVVNVSVAGDVYDQNTMTTLVMTVSKSVAAAVAPIAIKRAYQHNTGGMRDMLTGGRR